LIETLGFRCLKLKMGVYHPDLEVELVHEVRRTVGPDIAIRMDVNGVWSQSTAVRALKKLEDCDLEYMEDPLQTTHQHEIHDYRGMADLRQRVQTPLAIDGNYRIRNLVDVIRYDCADVVLGDFYGCNGFAGSQQFYYIARNFNLALSMHSGYEMGVLVAARAHLAAAVPGLLHPIDIHYHQLTDDVLAGGMLPITDGCITLTEEPGLGVTLDPDKLERYRWTQEKHEENQRVGEELHAKYEVKAPETWRFEHGAYPQW
jgi:glucarate dehydratase